MNRPGQNSSKIYLSRLETRNIDDRTVPELVKDTGSGQYEDEVAKSLAYGLDDWSSIPNRGR
jgi:hypothetical protein